MFGIHAHIGDAGMQCERGVPTADIITRYVCLLILGRILAAAHRNKRLEKVFNPRRHRQHLAIFMIVNVTSKLRVHLKTALKGQRETAWFTHIDKERLAVIKYIFPITRRGIFACKVLLEAAIGKIAGDQILKLQTLGLSYEEAEEKILEGFLR